MVRAIDDPLPGRISKKFAPGSIASVEWESAARNRLGEMYRSAARPLWQTVPSSASAVLFADYGELLACLARDLASGAAIEWWWQSILRRISIRLPGSWAAAWMEQPLFIPAALNHLEARRQAVRVLQRISPAQAWNLLTAMLHAFDLPALVLPRGMVPQPRAESAWPRPNVDRQSENAAAILNGQPPEHVPRSACTTEMARLPWEPYIPRSSTPPGLETERQALLGIGLLLHRAPQAAFSAVFPIQFRAWVNHQESRLTQNPADLPAAGVVISPAMTAERIISQERRATRSTPSSPERATPSQTGPNPPVPDRVDSAPAEPSRTAARPSPAKSQLTDPQSDFAIPPPAPNWADGESTCAGGILYLVHFVRQAELLRHFDTGLGAWALVELLARCLLDEAANVASDPIWSALAQLDGREPGSAPLGFQPRATYQAPASWVRHELESPLGRGALPERTSAPPRFARFRSRGLEIWTDEGFLVLDSTKRGRLPDGLHHLTAPLRRKFRSQARVQPISTWLSPELRRFLHFVLPYARWRLDRALGGTLIEDALRRKGSLYITATHVDLVMPMSEISLPVRMAGLDANPGWVPEFGRVISFHFT